MSIMTSEDIVPFLGFITPFLVIGFAYFYNKYHKASHHEQHRS